MGVSKKNKRKFTYSDQLYYWLVAPTFDENGSQLAITIGSENKKFLIEYYVFQQHVENRHIIVKGEFFPKLENTASWQRIKCPMLVDIADNQIVSSKHIKQVLDWCFDLNKEIHVVDVNGELISAT